VSTGIILKFRLRVSDPSRCEDLRKQRDKRRKKKKKKERDIFARYGNATARSEGLNSSRDLGGVSVSSGAKGWKKKSDKTSNLPITVRHASHLTKFIPKRGDAKPSAVYNSRIDA